MEEFNPGDQTAEKSAKRADRAERLELAEMHAFMKQERMPFLIRIAPDDRDLEKALQIRRLAYQRHLPEFAQKMNIESCDRDQGTAILLAESKLDGAPLGTMRIQTNEYA